MTLDELRLVRKLLENFDRLHIREFYDLKGKAKEIIEREIKLLTTNYVTGERTEGEK